MYGTVLYIMPGKILEFTDISSASNSDNYNESLYMLIYFKHPYLRLKAYNRKEN